MFLTNRREFLKALAVSSLFGSTLRAGTQERPFHFLVAGDSHIWGQGLEEKDKFYTHTAEWLRKEAFGGKRIVDLKVKAHSGATLKFHPDEAEKYKRVDRDENYYFPPEVNVGFPSVYKQIETAAVEYAATGVSGADLIMVGGGITDITTSRVFDPKGDDDALKAEIKKYCEDDLFDVLKLAAEKNPAAKTLVIGYFPAITKYSDSGKLLNAWLEALSFPRAFKWVANNPVARPIFFNKLRKRAIVRSSIWFEESNRAMKAAVDRVNKTTGSERAFFVESPLTDEHAAEAPKTKLFRMGKGGRVKDAVSDQRVKECRETLPKLKIETEIDYPVRLCEIAAIGHPDPAGSRMYADAIIDVIKSNSLVAGVSARRTVSSLVDFVRSRLQQ